MLFAQSIFQENTLLVQPCRFSQWSWVSVYTANMKASWDVSHAPTQGRIHHFSSLNRIKRKKIRIERTEYIKMF